jgi:hypothetical protein
LLRVHSPQNKDSIGTAADRTVRVLTAAIVAVALGMVGCGPHAAALPPGFPNLDSFAPVPVDNYITTGPKGPKRFVSFSTPYKHRMQFHRHHRSCACG